MWLSLFQSEPHIIVAAVVAAAAGDSTYTSTEAGVFIALNLLITVAACIQVSAIDICIDALTNCLEGNGGKVLSVCTDWICNGMQPCEPTPVLAIPVQSTRITAQEQTVF